MMLKMLKAKETISTTWLIRLAQMRQVAREHRLQVRDHDPRVHKKSRSSCGGTASKCKMTDRSDRWMTQLMPHLSRN